MKANSPSKHTRTDSSLHQAADEKQFENDLKSSSENLHQNLKEFRRQKVGEPSVDGSVAGENLEGDNNSIAAGIPGQSEGGHSSSAIPTIIEPVPPVAIAPADDLSLIPSCVIPVSFANNSFSASLNQIAPFHAESLSVPTSQFIDADSSIASSGRDLSRTSKMRNLLIKSPGATKSMNNLELVATSYAHALSLNQSLTSKAKQPRSTHGFSAMSGVAPIYSAIAQTPSHYYASPHRNDTPFSPIKRRKLFIANDATEKAIPGPTQLDEQFEDLPVFVHVATPQVIEPIPVPAVVPPSATVVAPAVAAAPSSNDLFKIPMNPLTAAASGSGDSLTKATIPSSTTSTSLPATPAALTSNHAGSSESHLSSFQPVVAPAVEATTNTTVGYDLLATKLKIASKGLCSVLPKASKVVTTRDWRMAQDEVRIANVLQSVEKLKEQNLWSFKQIKAQVHPPRPKVQWDYMLEEMMWMSEDFRQERRWKIAAAYNVSRWVLEWHATTDKSLVCVRVTSAPALNDDSNDIDMSLTEDSQVDAPEVTEKTPSAWRPGSALEDGAPADEMEVDKGIDPKSLQITAPHSERVSSFPITVDLSSNTYLLTADAPIQSGLSHIESYMCPVYNPQDLYKENEEQIVPVSKFMLSRYHVPTVKGLSVFGRPEPKEERLVRGNGNLYLKQLKEQHQKVPCPSSLFLPVLSSQTEEKEDLGSSELFPPPPGLTRPDTTTAAPGWTGDEEDALWQFAHLFNGNWSLVVDSLNGIRVGNSGKRSVWCCFDKYIELANGSFKPHSSVDYLYAPSQSNKKDRKVKALGMLSTFNFIIGLAKRRDDTRPKFSKPNKPVNLAAHSTHREVKVEKGIDPNAPPLRAIELTKMKELRDSLAEQSRQAAYQQSLGGRQQAMGPNVPRPMVPHNYNRPGRQMNPQIPQLPQQHNMAHLPVQNQAVGNMRPPFQGSPQQMPQQVMGSSPAMAGVRGMPQHPGYSAEQMQQMNNNNRNAVRPMGVPEQQAMAQVMQFNPGMPRMVPNRHNQGMMPQMNHPSAPVRTLSDASTAAAYTALSNVKQNNVRNPVGPIAQLQQQPQSVPEPDPEEEQEQSEQPAPSETEIAVSVKARSSASPEKRGKNNASAAVPSPSAQSPPPPIAKGQGTKSAVPSSSAAVNSSPPSRSSKRKNTSPAPPPSVAAATEQEEEDEEEEKYSSAASEEAPAKQPKASTEQPAMHLRRASRFSNPGASQTSTAPLPPSVALAAAAAANSAKAAASAALANTSLSGSSNGRPSRQTRKKKQPVVVSETEEDDELEGGGGEEEDELEHTEASTSIEEEEEVEESPKKPKGRPKKKGRK